MKRSGSTSFHAGTKSRATSRAAATRGTLYLHAGRLWGRVCNVGGAELAYMDYPAVSDFTADHVVGSVTHANAWRQHTIDLVRAAPPNGSVPRAADRLWTTEYPPLHKHIRYWTSTKRDELQDKVALALDPAAPVRMRVEGTSHHAETIARARMAGVASATLVAHPDGTHAGAQATRVEIGSVTCGYVPKNMRGKVATGEAAIVEMKHWGEGQWSMLVLAPRAC